MDVTNGWYYPSNTSLKLTAKEFFWNWSSSNIYNFRPPLMRNPGIKWRQCHIIWYFLSRYFSNCICISQLLRLSLLECHEMSRNIFKELKVTHLIWHPTDIIFPISTNLPPIYELWICCSSSKSPKKYGTTTLPITNPIIWYILHAKLICNIDWSHTKIVHTNDFEMTKFHIHNILINLTIDFLLDGSPLEIVIQSWNNVHWLCVIYTTWNHIWKCCITLHNRQF